MAPFKCSPSFTLDLLLNPFTYVLVLLDFAVWLVTWVLTLGPIRGLATLFRGAPAHEMKDDEGNGTKIFRQVVVKDGLRTNPLYGDIRTAYDAVSHSFAANPGIEGFGTRKYLGTYTAEKPGSKPVKLFGETTWQTYAEVQESALAFGAGLRALGMEPIDASEDFETLTGPHTMLIYEETCAQWITAMIGAHSQSLCVATSYATLGIDSVTKAANQCNVPVLFCNKKDVATVLKNAKQMKSLKAIIYSTNYVKDDDVDVPQAGNSGVKVLSFSQCVELGKANPVPEVKPVPETMAVIMYTSGSTGDPKGVMLTQANVCASISGIQDTMADLQVTPEKDVYCAYLPAAHILELCFEFTTISMGVPIGFADPKSISSRGAARMRPDGTVHATAGYPYPPGAIQEFRPTILVAVPKIWDIFKKGVEENVGKSSAVIKYLFRVAFAARNMALSQGRDTPLFNKVVFKKLTDMVGGRMRCGASGGGPISSEVQTFIRTAFCMPLVQGYALTETCCAGGCAQKIYDARNGVVGQPFTSCEVKLRSCPDFQDSEGNSYLNTDTSHKGERVIGRGEVLVRGPTVAKGYYKMPEKTAAEFDEEGFFNTGDIGVLLPDGALKIVDRTKNLIKLKGGEYIAIENMEKEYSNSVFVNGVTGGVCCYGDGDMDRPVAFVQANLAEVRKFAVGAGVDGAADMADEDLCANPVVNAGVLASLQAAAKAGKLSSNEKIVAVTVISGLGPETGACAKNSPWTPENLALTASNKLQRKVIQKVWAAELEAMKQKAIR
eukprot:CAMPEP_0118854572 /NCGR_PEP_ID=MMETSP1163-20130328/2733_1 /TAXON_ID=124430 /ORGANISM="Phaeomonas parva, Strain CCMP2877" /LENGTH=778 /DNA_ID=CAMNT_0006787319 /DNA_START=215 /DNA_END=2551 /DNA_ORIENTATION=+